MKDEIRSLGARRGILDHSQLTLPVDSKVNVTGKNSEWGGQVPCLEIDPRLFAFFFPIRDGGVVE